MGVNQSFFTPYNKKNALLNSIVHFSMYGLYNDSAEQKTCIDAANIICYFNDFQVYLPQNYREAIRTFETLIKRGFPLQCFNNFTVPFIRSVLDNKSIKDKNDIWLDIIFINTGRPPIELDLECSAKNIKLIKIASLYMFDALLAMFKLVNDHSFILPENVFDLHIANIDTLYGTLDLSQIELFLLASILQNGVRGETKLLMPSAEQAADIYTESINIFKDSLSMVNLGLLHQFGKFQSGTPDYDAASKYYAMAVDTNDDPRAKYNLSLLKQNAL